MRSVLAGIGLVVVLLAAGCGGGSPSSSGGNGEASKSAQQVLTDAVKAAKAASSLHMAGQITAVGQIGLDLTIVKGKGATGSMTLGGQKVDLVVIGKDAYMKAGAAFWTQFGGSSGSTIAQMLQGRWVKVPLTNAQFGEIAGFTDSKSLFDELGSVSGTPQNKGVTTYKGQSVVEIENQGKLYVASSGTPYPVAAVADAGSGVGGTITFDRWNEPVTLTAPSGALDFSNVHG